MEIEAVKLLGSWATMAKDAATALAVIVGGVWAFWKFVLRREAHAKSKRPVSTLLSRG
jgi:hypothetical protein